MKNYAMKMCSVKRLERTELEMPVAAADQVVVKIEYCGICGSDMHFFQSHRNKKGSAGFHSGT